jgi:uncharacterized protein (UPF0332 family)
MNTPSKEVLIQYRISRARETLKEVESMLEGGYWNAAINGLYYACYYSVTAALLDKGINAQTHAGVRKMFGLNFVHSGIVSR